MAAKVVSLFDRFRIVEKDTRSDYESQYFFEMRTEDVDSLGVVRWELRDQVSKRDPDSNERCGTDALILRVVELEKKLAEAEAKTSKTG